MIVQVLNGCNSQDIHESTCGKVLEMVLGARGRGIVLDFAAMLQPAAQAS